MNPQDRDAQSRSRHVQASQREGSSSPSDTRSNAATGLTQQGRANQRPQGERNDPSSEMQAGSSRDGRLAQQGSLGTAAQSERSAASQGIQQQPGASPFKPSGGRPPQTGEEMQGKSMLDEEDPNDPRKRS